MRQQCRNTLVEGGKHRFLLLKREHFTQLNLLQIVEFAWLKYQCQQINVALEGRFAFTVGDHTEMLVPGWAALTPRGVTHTGRHMALPYFQLIFATPPRGRGYAEFLRSIYRPRP